MENVQNTVPAELDAPRAVQLSALDRAEMQELVLDAWRMCVPKTVAAGYPAPNHPA